MSAFESTLYAFVSALDVVEQVAAFERNPLLQGARGFSEAFLQGEETEDAVLDAVNRFFRAVQNEGARQITLDREASPDQDAVGKLVRDFFGSD